MNLSNEELIAQNELLKRGIQSALEVIQNNCENPEDYFGNGVLDIVKPKPHISKVHLYVTVDFEEKEAEDSVHNFDNWVVRTWYQGLEHPVKIYDSVVEIITS